jgi:hypothetical protein
LRQKVSLRFDVEERAQRVSTDPPDTGIGRGCIPAARRTGGLSITRQPIASISTAR